MSDPGSNWTQIPAFGMSWFALAKTPENAFSLIETNVAFEQFQNEDNERFFRLVPIKIQTKGSVKALVKMKGLVAQEKIAVKLYETPESSLLDKKIPSSNPDFSWRISVVFPSLKKVKTPPKVKFAIFLESKKGQPIKLTEFVSSFGEGYDEPQLYLSGDLNLDGIPDLIVNESDKYSMDYHVAYISKKTGSKVDFTAIKEVGDLPAP